MGNSDEEEQLIEDIVAGVISQFLEEFGCQMDDLGPGTDKPPETEEEYRKYVWDFVNKDLSEFYKEGDPFVERIVQQAASKSKDLTTTYQLRPEVTPKLVKLALYDFFILCDDSGSMNRGNRRQTLEDTLKSVAKITTHLEPLGISLRFLNYNQDGEFNKLVDEEDIKEKVKRVESNGPTRLGTVLNEKIIQPFIIQKAKKESLERPVIVVIITDGEPTMEPPETLQNTILDCKNSPDIQHFGPASVVFLISRVGNNKEAAAFLNGLDKNKELNEVLYCCKEKIDDRQAVFQRVGNDVNYSSFLIKLFVAALDRQTK